MAIYRIVTSLLAMLIDLISMAIGPTYSTVSRVIGDTWASNPLKMLLVSVAKGAVMVLFSPTKIYEYWARQAKRKSPSKAYAYDREPKSVSSMCIA